MAKMKPLIIKHRGKKIRHKIKIAISNPFFPDLGYLPYSSLAKEDTHKNMNLINDTRIVFFLETAKNGSFILFFK